MEESRKEENKSDNDTVLEEKEEEIFAQLKDLSVIINKDQARLIFDKGYYGQLQEDQTLKLEPVEALLLSERRRIKVLDEAGNEYNFPKLVKQFIDKIPDLWVKYLCYKDLRSRGYIVRPGYGAEIDYRVYGRGAQIGKDAAKYFVHTVVEGTPLKLISLDNITKIAKSNRKKLVLAVVDRVGEVTFYKAQEVDL
ncbi:MAG: tRNA-intron lyase [Candidatus Helarchaeota archaeon]